ncbi:MAG: winged helix-turn-helix transcriptional regulator [Actinomycetota bacterium]|nr:winged helix-turn-helix transcriptional regulator [Actinomycetota bacterium]
MTNNLRHADGLVHLLAGRPTLAVLGELTDGGCRYQDLHDALDGIAHNVLTEAPQKTERDGLIVGRLGTERIKTATLYELTPLGGSLDEPLAAFNR